MDGGEYVKTAKIGRAIMDADVFISLTHFKGHETTGFGGAIKNIGMGCGSPRRQEGAAHQRQAAGQRSRSCRGCKRCQRECANDGLVFDVRKPQDAPSTRRTAWAAAAVWAPATSTPSASSTSLRQCRAELPHGRIHKGCGGRPPQLPYFADCGRLPQLRLPLRERRADPAQHRYVRFVRSAGARSGLRGCVSGGAAHPRQPAGRQDGHAQTSCDHHDHFTNSTPESEWRTCLEHAEKIGLGSRDYELITVK